MPFVFFVYLCIIYIGVFWGIDNRLYKSAKFIWICLLVTFISELTSLTLAHLIKNSSPPYHFLNILQISTWSMFFSFSTENLLTKKIVKYSAVILIIFSLLNSIFFQNIFSMPSNAFLAQNIMLIIWCILLYFEILEWPSQINIYKNSTFWATVALLFFHFLSFAFYLTYNFFLDAKLKISIIQRIHLISNYIFYGLLSFSVLLNSPPIKSEQSIT